MHDRTSSPRPSARRLRAAPLAALAVATLLSACAGKTPPDTDGDPANQSEASTPVRRSPVPIVIENRGYFDVNVYAIRGTNASAVRLGSVTGGTKAALRVRTSDLQPGGRLVLLVRAIGTRYSWTSSALPISDGTVPRLDVYTTASGDLSQSTLYAQVASTEKQ